MKGGPLFANQAMPLLDRPRRWWLFPIFWAIVFCIGLALSTLTLYQHHPQQLSGWAGVRLAVLLIGNFAAYMLIAWGWLYRDRPLLGWRGPLYFVVEMLLLLLTIWWGGAAFAWISLALLYPVIGGLPTRQWPLPIAALLLVFVIGSLPWDSGTRSSAGLLLAIALQLIVNFGIALVIRLMSAQSDRLRAALGELRQAHVALAASAEQKQELAVLRERARLARAMHDDLGHALVLMNIKLEAAQLLYARDPARGDAELEATRELIRTAMTELRRALTDLRAPPEHDDLSSALRQLAHELESRTSLAVNCRVAADLPPVPAEAREAIWYVAREALANAERHAAAASLMISLEFQHGGWLLRVVDDGSGVIHKDLRRPNHYGVLGMHERMKEIGGRLDIRRGVSGGTVVEAHLPQHIAQEVGAA